MAKIETIKDVQTVSKPDGVLVITDCETYHMSYDWYKRYNPQSGDYLTINSQGFHAVCPQHAFKAIMEVYYV